MKRFDFSSIVAFGVIIASMIYPLCAWLLGRSVAGYSHLHQQISELGVSDLPYAWVLTAVLLVNATLVLALSGVLRARVASSKRHRWAPRLLALYGIVLAIGGLFPCDAGCRPTSLPGLIHVLNVLPSMIAIVGAPLLVSRVLADDARTSLLSSVCHAIGVLTIVALLAALAAFPALGLPGLGQRVLLTFQLAFFVVLGFAVLHVQLTERRTAVQPVQPLP